jgi:hypothetical protein
MELLRARYPEGEDEFELTAPKGFYLHVSRLYLYTTHVFGSFYMLMIAFR